MKKCLAMLLVFVLLKGSLVCFADESDVIVNLDIEENETGFEIEEPGIPIKAEDTLKGDDIEGEENLIDLDDGIDLAIDNYVGGIDDIADMEDNRESNIQEIVENKNDVVGPYDTKIEENYKKCLEKLQKNDGKDKFEGWCGQYVRYQLEVNGINYIAPANNFNGNQIFYSLEEDAITSSGYVQKKYSGKQCLEDIVKDHGRKVENIVVSWFKQSKGTIQNPGFGHTNFIYGIIDREVYYSESYTYSDGGIIEGKPLKKSIDDFMDYYNKINGYAIGAVLFLPEIRITNIRLDKKQTSLNLSSMNNTLVLNVDIEPSNATIKTLEWTSSNEDVATVSENGLVKPVAVGEAIITCAAQDGSGKSASCKVTVNNFKLNKDKLDMYIGQTFTLEGWIGKKCVDCSFKSSNAKVVSVDNKGKLTAKKAGKATITVKASNNRGTARCDVKVHPKPTKIAIAQGTKKTLNIGDTLDLSVKYTPDDALAKIKWESSNEKVAKIINKGNDKATIKALTDGTTKITAKAPGILGKSATITITVVDPKKPTGLKISAPSKTVHMGEKLQLTAKLSPETAESVVSWGSSNTTIAKVSKKGVVIPVKTGTVTITATAAKKSPKGKMVSASIEITVKKLPASIDMFEYLYQNGEKTAKELGFKKKRENVYDVTYYKNGVTIVVWKDQETGNLEGIMSIYLENAPQKYNICGAYCGMTLDNAEKVLKAAGWSTYPSYDEDGSMNFVRQLAGRKEEWLNWIIVEYMDDKVVEVKLHDILGE